MFCEHYIDLSFFYLIMSLTEDCWLIVISKLSIKDFLHISEVNKMFNRLCRDTYPTNEEILKVKYDLTVPMKYHNVLRTCLEKYRQPVESL